MRNLQKEIMQLTKALEAGNYNVAPGQLVQGSALQVENLEPVMRNVTFDDDHIILQKMFSVKKSRSILVQFNRQLSYGHFGGSAQREGAVGDVDVGDYVRVTVPMCFYSQIRRVTIAANMVQTIDGVKAEDREAENAAKKIAGDIEFDLFRGKADFSNNGVFDGNPLAMADLPNIMGVDAHVRVSDMLVSTQDLMFASYGSNQSVVLSQNGALTQSMIEDASLRSRLNFGRAKKLCLSFEALTGYNKSVLGLGTANNIQRIILAGSAQDASGAQLKTQWTAHGDITLEGSRFLSGKTYPLRPKIGSPSAPTIAVQPVASGSGGLIPAGTYVYLVTAVNERGESPYVVTNSVTVAAGQIVTFTIGPQSGVTHFEVYRGPNVQKAKFIGRVKAEGGNTVFTDLGNKAPGFSTGFLVQEDTWAIYELAPFSRLKLAVHDLSMPEAFFRFLTLASYEPRKNVIIDNIT